MSFNLLCGLELWPHGYDRGCGLHISWVTETVVFWLARAGIHSCHFVSLSFNSIFFCPDFQWTVLGFTGTASVHISGNFKTQPESIKGSLEIAFLITLNMKYNNIAI